jgi:hypothetical protein
MWVVGDYQAVIKKSGAELDATHPAVCASPASRDRCMGKDRRTPT